MNSAALSPRRRFGIAPRLALLVLAVTGLVFGLIFLYSYHVARTMILTEVEASARHLAAGEAAEIGGKLMAVEKVAKNVAYSLEASVPGAEALGRLLSLVVERNPEIYGSCVAFAPYAFDPGRRHYAPYAFDQGRQLDVLGGEDYDYFIFDWYQLPQELGRPVWTEPYFDKDGGDIVMSTFAVPFYSAASFGRDFAGVVTADLRLEWLRQAVASIRVYDTGYAFLVSRTGTFITHPDPALVMNESLFSQAEVKNLPWLREIGRDMVRGGSAFVPFADPFSGRPSFLHYAPLPGSGWAIGVVFPEDELMAAIRSLRLRIGLMAGGGLALLILVVVLVARSITGPLRSLSGTALSMSSGDLDLALPALGQGDEVGDLARSLDHMRHSLKDYIRDLTETTAAKQRIQSELMIARDIQLGILPKIFPAFPERAEFDIFALIEPAKAVGGDFYTFFFLDERSFCFVIGDVSDKGVPAALFMAVTITLFKAKADIDLDPGVIMALVNEDLAAENENAMFVTVFLGILDTETGVVRYASGGHNPPAVVRVDGTVTYLKPTGNPVLGGFSGAAFVTRELTLSPGDKLFTYTDGVTEAMNQRGEIYSEARLAKALAELAGESPEEMSRNVVDRLNVYAEGEDQSDDITILALEFRGGKNHAA